MRQIMKCAVLGAILGSAGCGTTPDFGAKAIAIGTPHPVYVAGHPPCRVWDEDIFGRRYCRVRYVY